MLDPKVVDSLKQKFPDLHPLIFHRSLERARTGGELFDILSSFPKKYPVIWDEETYSWVTTKDIFQSKGVFPTEEKKS